MRKAVPVVLVLVGMLAVGAASARPRHRAHHRAGRSPALFNRTDYTLGSPSAADLRLEARRYAAIILQASDGRWVRALHRINPRLKIFVEQSVIYARATDPQAVSVCTSLPSDLTQHPSWFLRGGAGLPLTFGTEYIMDVGNRGYQQACIANAIRLAREYGFNGVFLEGTGASLAYQFPGAVAPYAPEYPTVGRWQDAMYSLLTYAGATIHASGLKVIANLGGTVLTRGLWQKWTAPLDGSQEESWTDGGAGLYQQLPWWKEKLDHIAWSEAHHKLVILHSYNTTEAGNTYGLASMLLVANGESTYSTANLDYTGYEAWYPEYAAARRLGAPLGHYKRLRSGVYIRRFAHGVVLVNPGFTGRRVRLRRGRTVSLGPVSGLILVGH